MLSAGNKDGWMLSPCVGTRIKSAQEGGDFVVALRRAPFVSSDGFVGALIWGVDPHVYVTGTRYLKQILFH